MKELLIGFLQYASWPISVVIIVLILKKPLQNLTKFKFRDVEIEINEEIGAVAQSVNKNKGNWRVNSTDHLKANMVKLSEKTPLAVVLQAWDLFYDTLENKVFIEEYSKASLGQRLQIYYDKQYISDETLNLFWRLDALKEKMKNFEGEVVTKERALEYADTLLSVCDLIISEIDIKKQINNS